MTIQPKNNGTDNFCRRMQANASNKTTVRCFSVTPSCIMTQSLLLHRQYIHCVGENYQPDSWMYRSCQFRNLCWDTETHEFLLFPSPEELALLEQLERLSRPDLVTISSISSSSSNGRGKV
jgi:hypothetical protein